MRLLILALFSVCCLPAKDLPREWKSGKIIYLTAEYGEMSMRQIVDIDAGDVTYTVDEWIIPQPWYRFRQGDEVKFVLDGKSMLVKRANSKPRKLRIQATYPKPKPVDKPN